MKLKDNVESYLKDLAEHFLGCEVNYSWLTTLGIQHAGAPIGWNSETTLCNTNGAVTLTACPPNSFRATRHALRCALPLRTNDLQKLADKVNQKGH